MLPARCMLAGAMSALHFASIALLLAAASCTGAPQADWPMGAGPNGNWATTGPQPPTSFSVTTGENIVWRTPMPETGQGGIAIANDRLFVTTMAPWTGEGLNEADAKKYGHAVEKRKVVGKHIDAHCLDQATGELLWTRRITGKVPSIYSYPFSDATAASPVANETHAWFTNAGGTLHCYTHAGELVWQRQWKATFDGPFNKQFEPFLVDDPSRQTQTIVHMEPFFEMTSDAGHDGEGPFWHYLVGLDALTGEELWRSEDALTQYNAPTLVATDEGPCVLHARGGPHQVPERPVGLTLTRATGANAGSKVWRYEDPRGNHEGALQTMACDDRYAYWLLREPRNLLVVLDRHTGEQVREISLLNGVRMTKPTDKNGIFFDEETLDIDKGVFPMRYSMIPANGRLYFQCYATAWGKPVLGAPFCFACIDPDAKSGDPAVRYLEVPTGIEHEAGGKLLVYRTRQSAKAINSRGIEVTGDKRSQWDGWDWVFNGTPTRVNDLLYFTLASGLVYVIDASQPALAFVGLNDLGAIGETWSANSVSYSDGRLYHRTAAELICVGAASGN
ncbi:MAG: outer membrane protein assembly factor BamB [Hyphomicrobiaceae bacterium]|jgi:outer membrane protein assembly factor BamB